MAEFYGFNEAGWYEFQRFYERTNRQLTDKLKLIGDRAAQPERPLAAQNFPIPFLNDSGEEIPAYAVMRVTDVDTVGTIPVIKVAKPSSAFQRLYLVNGPFRVSADSAQDKRGLGTWASDAAFVLYDDSNTPAYGEEWGPYNGSWEIKKYRYGFEILGGATGGDTDLVGCRQHRVDEFYGQTDGAHNKGSTGTISIFDGNNSDTTDNMASVQNRYGNVATTKKVTVRCHGGVWQIVSAECP